MIKGLLINMQSKCIYYKKLEGTFQVSPELVGCFFSAINTFAKNVTQDQISAIIMGSIKISLKLIDEKLDLYLILVADRTSDDSKLKILMEKIKAEFLNKFPFEEVMKYSNQPDFFASFDTVLNPLLFEKDQVLIKKSIYEPHDLSIEETSPVETNKIDLPLLFKTVKNLGKVIYSLFIGKRVVITGNSELIPKMIDTLEIFSPHRKLKKEYWADTYEKSYADIVGIPPDLADSFIDSTIINLEKNKVIGIKGSKYLDKLVKSIQKQPYQKALPKINEAIYSLIRMRSVFSELIEKNSISDSELNVFMKNIDTDSLDLIANYFYWNFPNYSDKVDKFCQRIKILSLAKDFLV